MISYNLIIIMDKHDNVSQCGNIKQDFMRIPFKCQKITFFCQEKQVLPDNVL